MQEVFEWSTTRTGRMWGEKQQDKKDSEMWRTDLLSYFQRQSGV